MKRENRDAIATENIGVNKDNRNVLWGRYVKDVIDRGLKHKITFKNYCERVIVKKN